MKFSTHGSSRSTALRRPDDRPDTLHQRSLSKVQKLEEPTIFFFFDDVSDALQKQIALLDAFERERFASFYSVIDLAESYVASGKNDVVLSTVLLCIAQVGSMIE